VIPRRVKGRQEMRGRVQYPSVSEIQDGVRRAALNGKYRSKANKLGVQFEKLVIAMYGGDVVKRREGRANGDRGRFSATHPRKPASSLRPRQTLEPDRRNLSEECSISKYPWCGQGGRNR
jgi:hypothetical protein